MFSSRMRLSAGIVAFGLLATACSGAPTPPDEVAVDDGAASAAGAESDAAGDGSSSSGSPGSADAGEQAGGTVDTTVDADQTAVDGGGAEAGEPGGGATGDASQPGGGGDATDPGTTGSGGDTGQDTDDGGSTGSAGPTTPTSNVYDAEAATIGITDDEIYFCGHAALVFAEAFDIRAEDLNVYWEAVNNNGGVYGRKVRIDWEDDAYNGNQAITAAQTCNSRDPFVLLGGIGFDQIPGVRTWAENNAVPYIHHIAVEPNEDPTHSFSFLPSVEQLGRAFGQYIASKYGDKKVGIIALESENWSPGHDAALAEMEAQGVEIVHDFEGARKGSYQAEIFQMQNSGVEVVWLWENALYSGNIISQAYQQQYFPTWVVFPFQTTLDISGVRSPIEGVSAWPAYAPGGYESGDPVGHNEDIAAFEAAFAEHRPSTEPNYLLYLTWVGHRALHQLLLDCGPDCDRNRLHGLLTSGYAASPAEDDIWQPNCAVDFGWAGSRSGHYGGFTFNAQQVYDHEGFGPAFRTTDYCVKSF